MLARRTFLKSAAAAGAASALGSGRLAAADTRPNVILICCDTWRADWLGCYGNQQIKTPAIDALAAKSSVFLEAYAEALPTVPARRVIYTGRRGFPAQSLQQTDSPSIRGWHPLYVEDVTLAESMRNAGYTTALIADLLHIFKPGFNFHRGFMSWRWIRGQEGDNLETGPTKNVDVTRFLHRTQPLTGGDARMIRQYAINRQFWKTEDDYPHPRTFAEAGRWLENNVSDSQPFFLQIETFSPHEMWDPPEDYYRLYMKGDYNGPRLVQPPSFTNVLTPLEVEHIRALYAGMVTFTDAHIGKFLAKVEALGLMSNTVIVFYADHGCLMGEQGRLRKEEAELRTQVTRVPLMIYNGYEAWQPRRVDGYVQHSDIMPTVLDLIGSQVPSRVTGESISAAARFGEAMRREWIVTGWGNHGTIRSQEWLYQGRWNPGEAFEELYDVRKDPNELVDVAAMHPDLVRDYRKRLTEYADAGWEITKGTFTKVLSNP
ncbi:MAG: sulfatase [Acidobacteria bacterium]|nr:sulfatase [Acidobacteriota bacterium]